MQGRLLEGKYRVSRLIGEGGMGAVYQAEHTLIGRAVALKVLHGDFAKSPEVLERFRREARAATAIRHPNIIEVTDMGMTPEGQPFLVMELLEGAPLSAMIGDGRKIPVARVADLLAQVLDALEAAHAKGIVHRDLKPDNVFVIREGNRADFVKLLDFGISKMTDPAGGGLSVTRTGSVMGTPNYMAPEQAMGRKDCDHRVDIWAVGVMLYEALTGRLPYLGDNYNELLTAILMTTPPAPRTVDPAIDPALERVVLRALAKEREQRYQLPGEFRDELNAAARVGAAAAVLAQPPPPPRRPAATASAPVVAAPPPVGKTMSTPHSAFPVAPATAGGTPPARPARPATLTPGGYDSPIPDEPRVSAKSPWALYAGAGAVAVAGIVVAIVLLSGKDSAPPAARDAATTPSPQVVPATAADAAAPPSSEAATANDAGSLRDDRGDAGIATAPSEEAGPDGGSSGTTDESRGVPDAGPADAARPETAPVDTGGAAPGRPDADGDAGADAGSDAGHGAARDAAPSSRDARPGADRGRPPARDAGRPARDASGPEDGRTSLRRDYI